MILVTNTIKIKAGHADAVAERFMNPKGVQHAPGFVRMELLKTEGTEEHDELKVCTTWESREAFDGWVNSDAFKEAHGRKGGASAQGGGQHGRPASEGQAEQAGEGPIMLGAKLTIHQVLFTHPQEKA
ncbi:antibiotic biosynthesis monooxygenase [Paenibacillus sambharensis]|uniref:Antibiotic biosynthesis monooxygenase n=1 Tax=Paenibacillus sambharensis TaxID=1803190 RepID=A0A2W1LPN7_9BACL|nr:antibiotic biosynthesis monooxygenase [Paenibacillus sambharensis]PZD96892.1 antibiotic biosynthesis monooxygenase [Paenibacillus sambharensis]